ncbi:citrate lyase beta subunit [Thiovulum sp. ES]|nr:citrate lyase beta subunit [Thiovulum sp. ES]
MSFKPIAPLMISTDNEKHISKIEKMETDSIILNLEDGVSDKKKALENCKTILKDFPRKQKFIVRVNALGENGDSEISEIQKFKPDAIRVPKIRNSDEVQKIENLIFEKIDIHLSIETKEALLNLATLRTSNRISVFYLGILDLIADLELSQDKLEPTNPMVGYLLSQFLVTSKALGVHPVAPVFQDYKNEKLFHEWLELEKRIGFSAKGVISPTQAKIVTEFFRKEESEIEKAREIVQLFQKNGSFAHDKYGYIDEPIYKGALAILNK